MNVVQQGNEAWRWIVQMQWLDVRESQRLHRVPDAISNRDWHSMAYAKSEWALGNMVKWGQEGEVQRQRKARSWATSENPGRVMPWDGVVTIECESTRAKGGSANNTRPSTV